MTATGTDMTAALQALLDPTALSLGLPTPAINKEEYLAICLAALAGTRAKALVGVGRRAAGAGLQAVVPEARGGERRRAWRRRGLVATLRNIVRRPLAFPSASGSSGPADADACALIARLLAKDPAARCPRRRRRAAALVAVVQGGADNAATADDEGGLLRVQRGERGGGKEKKGEAGLLKWPPEMWGPRGFHADSSVTSNKTVSVR
uniref:NPH3 domain-containing protein n=1 Tax=Oryza glumipatula TaxID=40148 RepID=A0A0D9YIT4_9ORYZ